jgi:hypothetical protein
MKRYTLTIEADGREGGATLFVTVECNDLQLVDKSHLIINGATLELAGAEILVAVTKAE